MTRIRSADTAETNIKVRLSSRDILSSLKTFLGARTQSDAIDEAHYRLTGSRVPLTREAKR